MVVRLSDLESHNHEHHSVSLCPLDCGFQGFGHDVQTHLLADCPKQAYPCAYCGLMSAASHRADHELSCGNKTFFCRTCRTHVLRRLAPAHRSEQCPDAVFDQAPSF